MQQVYFVDIDRASAKDSQSDVTILCTRDDEIAILSLQHWPKHNHTSDIADDALVILFWLFNYLIVQLFEPIITFNWSITIYLSTFHD